MKPGSFPVKISVLNGISLVNVDNTPTFVVDIPINDVVIHIPDIVTFGRQISLNATAKTGTEYINT